MRWLTLILAFGFVLFPARADEARFKADLDALTAAPHRLAGTPEGRDAAAYIERRLRDAGVTEVYPLDMSVWQTRVERCELIIDGKTVSLSPVRPNITQPSVTPDIGLRGPLLYVGQGGIAEYRDREVAGAIVVMEYDSEDHWERAFALGASAVIFLGDGQELSPNPKRAGVPSNLVRLYASPEAQAAVDLRRDRPQVEVHSKVVWELGRGRNLVARIPGTDPVGVSERDAPEALVIAVHYDSFGLVPHLSPGARAAANVAAALAAAERFVAQPAKRDIVLMFLDNQARSHQGARTVYEALFMTDDRSQSLTEEHADERPWVEQKRVILESQGLTFDVDQSPEAFSLNDTLKDTADFANADIAKDLMLLRMSLKPWEEQRRALEGEAKRLKDANESTADVDAQLTELDRREAPLRATEEELFQLRLRWDRLRRALHTRTLASFVTEQRDLAAGRFTEEQLEWWDEAQRAGKVEDAKRYEVIFAELTARAQRHLMTRLGELDALIESDRQRAALRDAMYVTNPKDELELRWIVLHATLNLGDASTVWGPVVGDWSAKLFKFRNPAPSSDAPGYYSRVLRAFSEASKAGEPLAGLAPQMLRDPTLGLEFAPGPFVSSGYIAGAYGVYNLSLMTGYDARVRGGQPSDTVSRLDWRRLYDQAAEATDLLSRVGDASAISLPRVFKKVAAGKYSTWTPGQSNLPARTKGYYAGLAVSGEMSEDRPAAGGMMGLWPSNMSWKLNQAWTSMQNAMVIADYDPMYVVPIDANGNFTALAMRNDMDSQIMTFGSVFDEQGRLSAVTAQDMIVQRLNQAIRVNLFQGEGYQIADVRTYATQPQRLKVLRAASDSTFRATRAMHGQLRDQTFFFISNQVADNRVKLFQPMGPVVLNIEPGEPYGEGFPADDFTLPQRVTGVTARDLYDLNLVRLEKLRERGVTSADLEILHSRSGRNLEQAELTADVAEREAALSRSAALSQRVYAPLRQSMDDLVYAIVVLLLLAIPFAFAMERLAICATSIYGRIGGFTVMFLVTFGLLYFMHPGFAIASTPIIIFLAFAIILLSAMVIYILVRKFQTELKAMQGQKVGLHDVEVSQAGTMLAAVGMGMSTMRRRPTRTILTAVTVVMLTFTILCFASFSRTVGVRAVAVGPLSEETAASVLVRKLDFSTIQPGVLDMLRGAAGPGGVLATQWWLVQQPEGANATTIAFTIARPDTGQSLQLDAVMGVSAAELEAWPQLSQALGSQPLEEKRAALESEGVYLPTVVQELLELEVGQEVLLAGHRVKFAGTIDGPALQRLRNLDGQSVIPVDFQDASGASSGQQASTGADGDDLLITEEVERDFVHLSADQVAVASNELVRRLGGELHIINLYPRDADVLELGRRLAEVVVMPIWAAGPEGVERMILTVLTEVSGGLALAVPLILGGLIIFGTLLGSISDREKEIYTFSALGLSPVHVGVLFFAEATVYAVVGGMGGQLLAQFVALGASVLSKAGYIQPASINYSSTNSLFAIGVVMATVIISAIYPALRASKSANPGLARTWRLPAPEGDDLKLTFPFTVSAYDITGVVSFLAEHFRRHDDAGLGNFAATDVAIRKNERGNLALDSELALAPFDLGVTQSLELSAVPSEIPGVDEVSIHATRRSGATGDWFRANKVFLRDLRKQFLLWRTLNHEVIEQYRLQTLQALGEAGGNGDGQAGAAGTGDKQA